MTVWVIRAEDDGAKEDFALARGCAVIGYTSGKSPIPDLSQFNSLEELKADVRKSYNNNRVAGQKAPQMWDFAKRVQDGDWVVMPLKTRNGEIAAGKCIGDYKHLPNEEERTKHRRTVRWSHCILRDDLSDRTNKALNRCRTVYSLKRDAAEEILRKIGVI